MATRERLGDTEKKLPEEYTWTCKSATKVHKKGRTKGGIAIGVRKGIGEEEESQTYQENILERVVKIKNEYWRIINIYCESKMEEIIKELQEKIENDYAKIIIGGDFNARTGEEGSIENNEGTTVKRKSKDKETNKDGKQLIKMIEERGWKILNGNMKGDKEGEYTYFGPRGETTVIDYVITNEETLQEIKDFKVGERTESDHQPITVETHGETDYTVKEEQKKIITDWSTDSIVKYREGMEKEIFQENTIDGQVDEITDKIKINTTQKEYTVKYRIKINKWWDKECRRKKKELRKALRVWKKDKKRKEEYKGKIKEYNVLCKIKKYEMKKKEEEEMRNIKTDNEAWKYINKERTRKTQINNSIELEEWERHFMHILEGSREKPNQRERQREENTVIRTEIKEEEVKAQIQKLKKKKAPGEDNIQNESWLYGTENLINKLTRIINRIWRGEGFPKRWRRGLIKPIYKAGEKNLPENYRGITLLDTAYKIYAMILNNKLKEEAEEKKIIPDNQAGFRTGRSGTDNIYILNHVISKEIKKERGKLYVFFADLKAAFDKVDRANLIETLRRKGISTDIVDRIEEIYEETSNVIQIGEKQSKEFWTMQVRLG